MASLSRGSGDRELDKICCKQFDDFCRKYGDQSDWEMLDPSKTFIPSFYLRQRLPQRHFRSEETHKKGAVRCLRFTGRRPHLHSRQCSLAKPLQFPIKGSKRTVIQSLAASTKASSNERLKFRVKKYSPLSSALPKQMEAFTSYSQERKRGKENLTKKSSHSSKDMHAESNDQPSAGNRHPFDERSLVS
ncbi:hypothetical protein Aperf_G00000002413 [Anoplocephala perfoliata]